MADAANPHSVAERLLIHAGLIQEAARKSLHPDRQQALAQYFTPIRVARLMAAMVPATSGPIRILDPGSGTGTLFATLVAQCLSQACPPESLSVTAYEIDAGLRPFLARSAAAVRSACLARGAVGRVELRMEDFACRASREQIGDFFAEPGTFDISILNPPYRKLSARSELRARLDALDIAAPNLYAAFLGLALRSVRPGGTVVAIVPRSFCNGTYFRQFRRFLLGNASLHGIHLFTRRDRAFGRDAVLQENVILALRRGGKRRSFVSLSFSEGTTGDPVWSRPVRRDDLTRRGDADRFIHLPDSQWSADLAQAMTTLPTDLDDLGLKVSTGPIVRFRVRESLADLPNGGAVVPLLLAHNLCNQEVNWPVAGRKAQALKSSDATARALIPNGWYVATRRFTTREEPRRVVASVIDPARLPGTRIALDNQLNYFHAAGDPLERDVAVGLATYLNSRFVDRYFRTFSGHTQVNASDLRKLRYPAIADLAALGASLRRVLTDLQADRAVRRHCKELRTVPNVDPIQERINEGVSVLRDLGMPREQLNDRSALTLLALAGLGPADPWSSATAPLIGVTPIMKWVEERYGRSYAPNTRETFRRFTLHQFVDAAIAIPNPDDPDRPVNSPRFCYQLAPEVLALIRDFGSPKWESALAGYGSRREALVEKYAQRREMARIPLMLRDGVAVTLTPGGHNDLVRLVLEEFCPRFVPAGTPVYVGDAGRKWAYYDRALAKRLGISVDEHGKMPDVVIHDGEREWLVVVEAVTSHGPVDAKRIGEMRNLFKGVGAGLVFVTAFPDRRTMVSHLNQIAWQTEVWISDSPGHLIHFDGDRFLGPYNED